MTNDDVDALELLHALLPFCPLCSGSVSAIYSRPTHLLLACDDCQTSINVPASAWHIAERKQKSRWPRAQ
jgi:hypothetical protein